MKDLFATINSLDQYGQLSVLLAAILAVGVLFGWFILLREAFKICIRWITEDWQTHDEQFKDKYNGR